MGGGIALVPQETSVPEGPLAPSPQTDVAWTSRSREVVTDLWKDTFLSWCCVPCGPTRLHGSVKKKSSDSNVLMAQVGNGPITSYNHCMGFSGLLES